MCTRKYLKVEGKTVTLTDDHMDPKTVFRLHPVIMEKDQIEYETYCRIEQVVSNHWLHAELEDYKRKQFQKSDSNEMSMTGLPWTRAPLKKITVSQEMQYDDAFTLQEVREEHLFNFNFMAGMVPGIQKILEDKKAGHTLKTRETTEIIEMLQELQSVLVMNSVPNKNKQKLVRNLRIVELLVKPTNSYECSIQSNLTAIMVQCYDTLHKYLMGDSRKNELYMAKHLDFFESQIANEGYIGLNAAHMVMELVKDNRKIVDRITHKHIDHFVDLLKSNKQELQSDEEFLFLDHQLDLFGKLCYGRNEYAINVITEKLGYLTWQEAFCCLTDDNLPDQLKAKYCHLIIVLFVDVGANMSVLDRVNLTFVYHYIGEDKRDDEQDINKDMTASDIGHNMLVQQVLRLVHYLAKFGYYGDLNDIEQLMGPLLSVNVLDDVLKHYRETTRYQEHPETQAIVDAKYQAMEVLDLFFNYRFNIRLEWPCGRLTLYNSPLVLTFRSLKTSFDWVGDGTFKVVLDLFCQLFTIHAVTKGHMVDTNTMIAIHHPSPMICGVSTTDLNQLAVKKLQDIFDKSALFTNYPMVDVLLVLITKQSIEVLAELHKMLPVMQRLTSAKMTQEQTKQMSDMLSKMITYHINFHVHEPPSILSTVFDILSQEIDIRLMVFTGNKSTCLKVFSYQVQKIMQLVSSFSNKAPQFLDLLNALVKGENRFIESICQTIFSIKELLEILTDANISNNLKRPYVRFLLWVYLNTASGMIDSGAGDLPHDDEQGHGDWKKYHGSLHYILDAVLPFLLIFFRSFYQPDRENHPEEADYVDTLAQSLVDFSKVVGPLISNPTHMKSMVGCINVILSTSTLAVNVMEDFQQTFGAKASMGNISSDARKEYLASFQQEEELNGQLNVFAINYSATYGGYNDVKTQIGFDKIEKGSLKVLHKAKREKYKKEIPNGREAHTTVRPDVNCKSHVIRVTMIKPARCELISASANYVNEWDRLNQEQLDNKCLQLLRALVHNQIVQLPLDWEFDVKKNNKRSLIAQHQAKIEEAIDQMKTLRKAMKNGRQVEEVLAVNMAGSILLSQLHASRMSMDNKGHKRYLFYSWFYIFAFQNE
ncbi:hypothetical protein LSH36_861g02042 [Paralvinella palmiformis]|uniref:RIH domain-containing protein n=1 Tax=Paralvinella palmiformis TaxID=53620 RepID=A0AAD9IZL0_9ANNE|nr:hypothetical protein LSH36_861g02042 [Paralvinella palmiformis]